MAEDHKVDIVIVNWNSGEYLRACVRSVLTDQNAFYLGSVIIVDNASSDDSLERLPDSEQLNIVKNNENLGFSRACNVGFRCCTSGYILLLNPDTLLLKDTLKDCVAFMNKNVSIDVVGCQLLNERGLVTKSCARFPTALRIFYDATGLSKLLPKIFTPATLMTDWDHATSRQVEQVMGAFMFMRSNVFEKAGYFDERFFVYFEELDFSNTLVSNGGQIFFNASIHAVHAGQGTTKAVKGFRLFLFLRSKLIYARKHFRKPGFFLCVFATYCIEPVSRMVLALLKGKLKEIRQIWIGYCLLIKDRKPGK